MGRGDRHKVRWAHDRARKKKARAARKTKGGAEAKPGRGSRSSKGAV